MTPGHTFTWVWRMVATIYIATVIWLKVVEFISAPLETRLCTSDTPWLLPYSGKLSREKTFANWLKYDFRGENFRRLLAFAVPKDATPQISQRKFSRIATKPQKSRKFSPSKVFRYTVFTPPKQLYTSHVALLIDCDQSPSLTYCVSICLQWIHHSPTWESWDVSISQNMYRYVYCSDKINMPVSL